MEEQTRFLDFWLGSTKEGCNFQSSGSRSIIIEGSKTNFSFFKKNSKQKTQNKQNLSNKMQQFSMHKNFKGEEIFVCLFVCLFCAFLCLEFFLKIRKMCLCTLHYFTTKQNKSPICLSTFVFFI